MNAIGTDRYPAIKWHSIPCLILDVLVKQGHSTLQKPKATAKVGNTDCLNTSFVFLELGV